MARSAEEAAVNEPHGRWEAEDDAGLLRSVARGDQQAFHRLYLAYFGRLGRFLARVTTRPELTEEIINDTMLAVWRQAGQFRGDSMPSTWIFGIAYRLALKALRRDQPAVVDALPEPDEDDEAEGLDELLGRAEVQDWLQQGLTRLSAEQRLAVELAYFMEMTCEEIAAITGAPAGTVKTRIYHARRHLRRILRQIAAPGPLRVAGS